jgi:hypothetical protein
MSLWCGMKQILVQIDRASRHAAINNKTRYILQGFSRTRKETSIQQHFSGGGHVRHAQPNTCEHANCQCRRLLGRSVQMEGASCDSGSTVHCDCDGSKSHNDRPQLSRTRSDSSGNYSGASNAITKWGDCLLVNVTSDSFGQAKRVGWR